MRLRAGFLVAVGVGLAGCKNLDKSGKDDRAPPPLPRSGGGAKGSPASKSNPHWLDGPDDSPSLDAPDRSAPGRTTADPRDMNYDARAAVKGTLAGFVDDPEGRKLRGVYITVEPATGPLPGKPLGVQTDDQGYFQMPGLKSGQTYVLSANTTRDGRSLGGQVYVRPPNVYIRLSLVEGVSVGGGGGAKPAAGGDRYGGNDLPAPTPLVGTDYPPRTVAPPPAPTRPDGWSPVSPPPASSEPLIPAPAPPPGRGDLFTDGPPVGNRPPVTSIPNPTPPTFTPPPVFDSDTPGRSQSRSIRPKNEFVLIDTLGRPRDFPSGDPNQLLLIEFMTTTCPPCKKAIPLLADFQSRWAAKGVEVIGVACDAVDVPKRRAVAGKYYRDNELNYLLYVEPGESPGPVMDRFQVEFYPSLVLLSGSGDVLWTGDPRQMDKLERVVRERLAK